MKKMSKLLALVLTLVMALSLVSTAFAEDPTGGTITITGETTRTYDVYKMFDVEVVNSAEAKYRYKALDAWKGFTAEGYLVIEGNQYVRWLKPTASKTDGAAIAELAKNYLTTYNTENTPGIESVTSIPVNASRSLSENGYYLLVPNDNSTCGVLLVVGGGNYPIIEKSVAPGMPTVTKKVLEDSTNTYGASNDTDIGEKITFQTTITAGDGAVDYILHEKMCEHLVWDNSGVGFITRDGNKLEKGDSNNPKDFYVVENPDDECTFHIVFSENTCKSLHEGATLVVNYFADLKPIDSNEDATIDADDLQAVADEEHENKTWLTHTKQQIATDVATTETHTYNIKVTKKDTDGNLLAGAGFVLKDNVNKYYSWNKEKNQVEWVPEQSAATELTTGEDGEIIFAGVDAENFTLIETIVPGGYTGGGETAVSTKNGNAEVTVINTLGSALPETGGVGTTLFYVAGGLLVAAAVVLLALKKRKAE